MITDEIINANGGGNMPSKFPSRQASFILREGWVSKNGFKSGVGPATFGWKLQHFPLRFESLGRAGVTD